MRKTLLSRILPLVLVGALGASTGACAQQEPFPNINDAEAALQSALQSLQRAPDRFGGHKAEAARLIRGAITELEQAKADAR